MTKFRKEIDLVCELHVKEVVKFASKVWVDMNSGGCPPIQRMSNEFVFENKNKKRKKNGEIEKAK